MSTRALSKIMRTLITQLKGVIPETLSNEIIQEFKFMGRQDALMNIHFPPDTETLEKAKGTLKI